MLTKPQGVHPLPTLYIVCHRFYDTHGTAFAIGGVETYVRSLSALAVRNGWAATILQYGDVALDRYIGRHTRLVFWNTAAQLARALDRCLCAAPGVVVYSDFGVVPPRLHHPCILLQHGVGWDNWYYERQRRGLSNVAGIVARLRRAALLRRIRVMTLAVDSVICVDTNFINVLRATYPRDTWSEGLWYVPNFAELPSYEAVNNKWRRIDGATRCIFPRRFTVLRGAMLFAEIVRDLAVKYSHVQFGFVGEGVCESQMRLLLANVPNVEIYGRPHEEMGQEYLRSHIAVIPTIAAEGTSLSCIEAMAAGCAVVATNVGGLCNLIVPDVTGLLCVPTKADVTRALIRLLDDPGLRVRLGRTARIVAERGFSRARWDERVWAIVVGTAACYGIIDESCRVGGGCRFEKRGRFG